MTITCSRPTTRSCWPAAVRERRFLETTLFDEAVSQYVLYDRHVASSWIWRKIGRQQQEAAREPEPAG